MIHCPACNTLFERTRSLCPHCGFRRKPRNSKRPHCPVCKEDLIRGEDQCHNCGYVFPVRIHNSRSAITAQSIHANQYAAQVYYPRVRSEYLQRPQNTQNESSVNSTDTPARRTTRRRNTQRRQPPADRRESDELLSRQQNGITLSYIYLAIQLLFTIIGVIFPSAVSTLSGWAGFFGACVLSVCVNRIIYSFSERYGSHLSIWFLPLFLVLLLTTENIITLSAGIVITMISVPFLLNRSETFPLFYRYCGRLILSCAAALFLSGII